MKPKKSSFFFNQFSFFLMFFTLFVFAIFYRFMYKSDYQGTFGFNSFFMYVVVCSQCSVVEKVSRDFCRKLQQNFLVHCVSIIGLGYVRIDKLH